MLSWKLSITADVFSSQFKENLLFEDLFQPVHLAGFEKASRRFKSQTKIELDAAHRDGKTDCPRELAERR